MALIAKPMVATCLLRLGVLPMAVALIIEAGAFSASTQEVRRPLNPGPSSSNKYSSADRAFRIAFDAANTGDFDTAVINYGRASQAARDACDRAHAVAGRTAALEAKALLNLPNIQSKPSQFFWIRIQELTKGLSCVWIR